MANDWFRFKKFIVYQKFSAMKVSTDACIFGAWVARNLPLDTKNILDIGAGTGLLSLMLLQEHTRAMLTALEPEQGAALEAEANIGQSDWGDRAEVIAASLQTFSSENAASKFDFIICNPPFFQNHLLGREMKRNTARHDSLLPETLAKESYQLSENEGHLAIIYPQNIWENWLQEADKAGWFPKKILVVQPASKKPPNRICCIFGKEQPQNIVEEQLLIREEDGTYSGGFKELLSPFYLNL